MRTAGPHSLKTQLVDRGLSCSVIDFYEFYAEAQLDKMVYSCVGPNTCVVGLSTTFLPKKADLIQNILLKIKAVYPHIQLVVGGYNAKDVALRYGIFDAVFTGYADDTFAKYCDWVCAGQRIFKAKTLGESLLVEGDASTTVNNSAGASIDWYVGDALTPQDVVPLETARGCIFSCKFCSYPGLGKTKGDHVRSATKVKEELLRNYEMWGVTHYNSLDDTFNDSADKVEEFWNMSQSLPFKLKYVAYIRADLVWSKPETAMMLKDSGLVGCFFGIETLDRKAAVTIGKGWSGSEARDYVPHLVNGVWNREVCVTLGIIIGLPYETYESMWNTFDWASANQLDVQYRRLGLSGETSTRRSAFDIDATKYGLRKLPNNKWETDYTNYDEALRVATEMNRRAEDAGRHVDSRQFISALALGVDGTHMLNTPGKVINQVHKERSRQHLISYHRKFIETRQTKALA